jgi:hypothetical protein
MAELGEDGEPFALPSTRRARGLPEDAAPTGRAALMADCAGRDNQARWALRHRLRGVGGCDTCRARLRIAPGILYGVALAARERTEITKTSSGAPVKSSLTMPAPLRGRIHSSFGQIGPVNSAPWIAASHVGSAPRSGRGGRRFKSYHSDQHLAEIPTSTGTDCGTVSSDAHAALAAFE